MRALRFHGNKDIRLDDVSEPALRPGWVKVKIAWNGICGSDLHEYNVGPMNAPIAPHALTGETVPTILGHEFSGTIVDLGDDVSDLEVGQKVVIFPVLRCGACHWCQMGSFRLCDKWGFLGYSGFGGGMAEYICVSSGACHKIPDHIGLDVAALVEPLAVGWHAVKEAKVEPSDHCLVIGAGPIGISVVHCLVAHGVTSIMVSEPSVIRLEQAKVAGAPSVFNPQIEDVPERCRENSDGFGANIVFECAGMQTAFDTALASVRGRGLIVNVAVYETNLKIQNPNVIGRFQLTVRGSNTYTQAEYDEVIQAITMGKIKQPENMITARVPLSRAIEDGFMALKSKNKHVKILVSPGL